MTFLKDFDGIENKNSEKIIRSNTRISAVVYPHVNSLIHESRPYRRRNFSSDEKKSEGSIIAFSYQHVMGQASAQFQLTIKISSDSDLDVNRGDIADFDWIDIEVNRNDVKFPLLRGVVDTVSQDDRSNKGVTVRTITVQGRSHGALFETKIIWNNAYVQTISEIVSGLWVSRLASLTGGSPSYYFQLLFDAAFNSGNNPATSSIYELPEILKSEAKANRFGSLCKIIKDTPSVTQGQYYNDLALWTNPGDTLHAIYNDWCNPLLNEFFYDLAPYPDSANSKYECQATIRERPFINTTDKKDSPFFKLKKWSIPPWVIGEKNLSRSGSERFTLIELLAEHQFGNTKFDQMALTPVLYSQEDARRYGIRPRVENTKYYVGTNMQEWRDVRKQWQRLLVDWYGPNPYFLSGQISVKPMLPEIRIGQRLCIDTDGTEKNKLTFYIEGISHFFLFPKSGIDGVQAESRFTVTRGIRGSIKEQINFIESISKRYTEPAL